jgi:hypothetical protein
MMVGMDRPVGPALRWSRAALLGAVTMSVGAVAHVTAGGLVPGTTALLVLSATCVLAVAPFLGRPASTVRAVVLLMAGQAMIHAALTSLAGHRGDPAPSSAAPVPSPEPLSLGADGRRVGSLYDQVYGSQTGVSPTSLSVPAPIQHLLADVTGPNALMALAHFAAAAVIGLWLAVGERALWTVLALTVDGVRGLVRHAFAVRESVVAARSAALACMLMLRSRAVTVEPPHLPPRWLLLARSVVRRGPPALLAA